MVFSAVSISSCQCIYTRYVFALLLLLLCRIYFVFLCSALESTSSSSSSSSSSSQFLLLNMYLYNKHTQQGCVMKYKEYWRVCFSFFLFFTNESALDDDDDDDGRRFEATHISIIKCAYRNFCRWKLFSRIIIYYIFVFCEYTHFSLSRSFHSFQLAIDNTLTTTTTTKTKRTK